MKYRGRSIDAVSFWSSYVEFHGPVSEADTFAPLVQCPNPEHDTLKSHFQVNLAEPMVHCFAHCGISGTWEHAICVIEGLYEKFKVEGAENDRERRRRRERALREARKTILRSASGLARPSRRQQLRNPSRPVVPVPADDLRYESFLPQSALTYLAGREISKASVAEWELGWHAEDKRLVIPAKDLNGKIRFLVKRSVNPRQQPKYLYTEGFPKTSLLFGACGIDLGMVRSEGIVLVEGSLDVIRFHQHGLRNSVGIMGTGISNEQVRIIEKLAQAAGRLPRIVFAFDKDTAGIHNIEIATGRLRKYPLYVMKYPRLKFDPAELSAEEAYRQIRRAVPAFRFINDNGLNVKRRKDRSFG